jgi:hypothetical protein
MATPRFGHLMRWWVKGGVDHVILGLCKTEAMATRFSLSLILRMALAQVFIHSGGIHPDQ